MVYGTDGGDLENDTQKGIEFSKERSEFYDIYRQKKLKKLKHIDVNGEKAGLLGRIFKGKKKWATLEELLKSNYCFILPLGHEEETKVLELDDKVGKRDTTMKATTGEKAYKPSDFSEKPSARATTKGDKEYYRQLEEENERKLFGDKKGMATKDSVGTAQDQCDELKNQMNQNLQALNERGEKIEELQDKR